jgi:hypothetical protein
LKSTLAESRASRADANVIAAVHDTGGAAHPDCTGPARPSRLRITNRLRERRNWIELTRQSGSTTSVIIFAIFAVIILLLSSSPAGLAKPPTQNRLRTLSSPNVANNSNYVPYQVATSLFPTASALANVTDNSTLARVVSSSMGLSSIYSLIYVDVDPSGNHTLVSRTGLYNTTLAGSLAGHAACVSNCPWNLPIEWSAPMTVARLGQAVVTGTAVSAVNESVAVAASTSSGTQVFYSPWLGALHSWVNVTGTQLVAGGNPNITVQPCRGILLTTQTPTNLVATSWVVGCPAATVSQLLPNSPPPSGGGPYVTGVSPSSGTHGTSVSISGGNFASGAGVTFGGVSATSVTYNSPSQLHATAPVDSGIVDIVVTVGSQSSPKVPADVFTYSGSAPPTVSSISPNNGLPGTPVVVLGTNFTQSAIVEFGTVRSTSVRYVSTTQLNVTSPANKGTVGVTVTTAGGTSVPTADDWYTYPVPTISGVAPPIGYPTATAQIFGTNFASGATVKFGNAPSPQVTYVSSTQLRVLIPWVSGTVYVRVTNPGGSVNVVGSAARFSMAAVPLVSTTPTTTLLPRALSAQPVWTAPVPGVAATIGILASNLSNSEVIFYWTTQPNASFHISAVSPFSTGMGSAVFDLIGATRLETPGGSPGMVAVTYEGPLVFGLFTTRSQNRTTLETATSNNLGATWGESYVVASPVGSVKDPRVAVSPAGYVYGTWLGNGGGPWAVETQTFAPSGRPIGTASVIPGSQGAVGGGAQTPSVAVDGLQRPLYMWTANDSSGLQRVYGTGAYLYPTNAARFLNLALNNTTTTDYVAKSHSAWISTDDADLTGNLTSLIHDVATSNICGAELIALTHVYPDTGWFLPRSTHNTTTTCGTFAPRTHVLVANQSGATAANTTLQIEGQWLLEALGFGVFSTPNWLPIFSTTQTGAPVQVSTNGFYSDGTDSVSVATMGINPKTVALNVSWSFNSISRTSQQIGVICNQQGGFNKPYLYTFTNTDAPLNFTTRVWINSATAQPYTTNGTLGTVYLTNLSLSSTGTWHVQVTATYQQQLAEVRQCGASGFALPLQVISPITIGPSSVTLSTSGTYSTKIGYVPGNPPVVISNQSGTTKDQIKTNWTNSLLGQSGVALLDSSTHASRGPNSGGATGYALRENFSFSNVTRNDSYILYTNTSTYPAQTLGNWSQTYNTAQNTANTSAVVIPATCPFTDGPNPVHVSFNPSGSGVTGINATSAVLTWSSGSLGTGWVLYKEAYGEQATAQATEFDNNSTHYYRAHLRGLTPWGTYAVTVGVTFQTALYSCLFYSSNATGTFKTASKFSLNEYELPYDSVSGGGGGAIVYWMVPDYFVAHATFLNGTATVLNSTASITVPVTPSTPDFFLVNWTALQPNNTYTMTAVLNFSYANGTTTGTNYPFSFRYEQDTSGDGLTDWEKVRGWEVTYQNASGTMLNKWVTANPQRWSTNGLTSDFVEKEFGLNPYTVDTAGSHMLDTWNLTFDLGPKSSPLTVPAGANFRYWDEAGNVSSDYTWTNACQYFTVNFNTCWRGTNVTGTWWNLSGNDSWGWAAKVLWSRSALANFTALPGVLSAGWLRATLGNNSQDWTLTVWGKLSWGANPLAASTPRDGTPDGARTNALYDQAIVISSLSASLTACPRAPSGGSYGWAPLFYLNWSSSSGPPELPAAGNYSREALDNSTNGVTACGALSNIQIPIPVNGTSQNLSLQVRVMLNLSASPTTTLLKPQAFSGSSTEISVTYDAASARLVHYPSTGSYSGTNGTLSFTLSSAQVGMKANTLLWLPNAASTLNSLPWGLRRYTGEQAFDLIIINQTTSGWITSRGIPSPQNASQQYTLRLAPGPNNLLIPRSQFTASVLGEALLLGAHTGWKNLSARPPLLASSENASMNFGSSNPLLNLGCYWQNRALNNTTGTLPPICNGTAGLIAETGTPLYNSSSVATVAQTTGSGFNVGGVPSNSAIENSSAAGAAVQSILTLNITSQTTFDLLLAALLDNTTGGLNGTFLNATAQIPIMGLSAAVVDASANFTLSSGGLFGVPWGVIPPPPKPGGGVLGWLVNSATGIAKIGLAIISAPWTIAFAIAQLIDDHLPTWLKNLGATIVARTAQGLAVVGGILKSALALLTSVLLNEATVQAKIAFAPVAAPAAQTGSGLHADLVQGTQDVNNNQPAKAQALAGDTNYQAVHTLLVLIAVAAIAFAITVVLSLISGDVADLLVAIILSAIVALALAAVDIASHGVISLGSLVWWTDNLRNCTSTHTFNYACTPGSTNQQAEQPIWNAAYLIFSSPTALGLLFGLISAVVAFSGPQDLAVAVALAGIGIYLTLYGANNPNQRDYTDILSSIFDFASLYYDLRAIAGQKLTTPGANILAGATIGLDAASLVADAYS